MLRLVLNRNRLDMIDMNKGNAFIRLRLEMFARACRKICIGRRKNIYRSHNMEVANSF